MAAPASSSGNGWPNGLPPAFPDLLAVVADTPDAFSAAAATGPFSEYPCHLAPLHLAAALGREKCVRALLSAGASPWLWTRRPPAAPRASDSDDDADSGGEGDYAGYESVCGSSVYQALKQQLPNSSPFPYTFTLAQLLLRIPCSPLGLAVRFGQQAAARALLVAMQAWSGGNDAPADVDSHAASSSPSSRCSSRCSSPDSNGSNRCSGGAAALALHLDAALAVWPAASEPTLPLLRRLLAAGGGANPLRHLLPAILSRYRNCSNASSMAEHLRQGLHEVLQHVLPSVEGGPGGPASDYEGQPEEEGATGAEARLRWRYSLPLRTGTLHQLLHAAVACRDSRRGTAVLAALESAGGGPWRDAAANCALLAAAAAHDCEGVVEALLALPPPPGGGLPPFNPDMWGPDGLSALMAAAHRGALGSLAVLLAAGATVNLADEMGASALHWAVVGGRQDAVVMLAQAGAAVDLTGVAHEEEEHLERPLLTAAMRCDPAMLRLLHALGASLDVPAPSGATPLSVAVCWERLPAVRLLLELGADPNQVLPAHIAGGAYPMWSDSYSAEEAFTLLGMACSRCDHADIVGALLEGGADPSLRHPLTGLTPAAEAASIGAVDEAAELIERAAVPVGCWTLERLGWAEAVAQAVGTSLWHHVASPVGALQPLLDAWRLQPGPPPPPPPPPACRAIVAALLDHPVLQLADGAAALQSGAEQAGVLQAEALASIGVASDLTHLLRQPGSECRRYVILAAAPAASRWSPAAHRHFPPAFKHTVRALLLALHRLGASRSDGGGSLEPRPAAGSACGSAGALPDERGQPAEEENEGGPGPAPLAADPAAEAGGDVEGLPPPVEEGSAEDRRGMDRAGERAALAPATPAAAEPAPSEPGGGGGGPQRRMPKVASAAELGGPAAAGGYRRDTAAGEARAHAGGSAPAAASSPGPAAAPSLEPAGSGSGQAGVRHGADQRSAGEEGAADTAGCSAPAHRGPAKDPSPGQGGPAYECQSGSLRLPRDTVHEVIRLLGSTPLSYWMAAQQPQGWAVEGASAPAAAPHLLSFV